MCKNKKMGIIYDNLPMKSYNCIYRVDNTRMFLSHNVIEKIKNQIIEFQPRWRRRWKPFASSHNQKEGNNQSKINKQPEVPENQTARNSDNHGNKQSHRTARPVREKPQHGERETGCTGGADWTGN